MKKLANFVLFQTVWFAAVLRAVEGDVWTGLAAAAAFVLIHLALLPAGDRPAELRYALLIGFGGAVLDSGLLALGVTAYPTSQAWSLPTAPPWILGLWIAFALLPRFSLAWMKGRYALAALFGAIGGPLSYAGGVRLGATGADDPWWSYGGMALEYALVFPLMLAWATGSASARR